MDSNHNISSYVTQKMFPSTFHIPPHKMKFQYFSDPFLGLVHNCLGKEYNSEMRKVYQSVADFLIQTLTEGYNGDVLVAV